MLNNSELFVVILRVTFINIGGFPNIMVLDAIAAFCAGLAAPGLTALGFAYADRKRPSPEEERRMIMDANARIAQKRREQTMTHVVAGDVPEGNLEYMLAPDVEQDRFASHGELKVVRWGNGEASYHRAELVSPLVYDGPGFTWADLLKGFSSVRRRRDGGLDFYVQTNSFTRGAEVRVGDGELREWRERGVCIVDRRERNRHENDVVGNAVYAMTAVTRRIVRRAVEKVYPLHESN